MFPFFTKQAILMRRSTVLSLSLLNEEVNRTEPFLSIRVPWLMHRLNLFFFVKFANFPVETIPFLFKLIQGGEGEDPKFPLPPPYF
jgi:hypothetical protein